jgi:hypothetical protein
MMTSRNFSENCTNMDKEYVCERQYFLGNGVQGLI